MSTSAIYAGLGIRLSALVIDYAILAALATLPLIDRPAAVGYEEAAWEHLVLLIVLGWPYFALSESSSWQGTPGKKLLGLRVCDLKGNRISLLRANVRYSSKLFFYLIWFVSPFTVAFTSRKQALHDYVVDTSVLREEP